MRPSSIVGIKDEWTAYQFDSATVTLNNLVVAASYDKTKSVERVLDGPAAGSDKISVAGRFADIKQLGPARKMKVPESGVW